MFITDKIHRHLVMLAIVSVTGCATSTDPSEGGFFNGVSALSSGAYEQRVTRQEAQLGALQAQTGQLQARASELQGEQAQNAQALTKLEQDVAGLEASLKQLTDKLTSYSEAAVTDREKFGALSGKVASLTNSLRVVRSNPTLSVEEKSLKVQQLLAQQAQLEQGLREAMSLE